MPHLPPQQREVAIVRDVEGTMHIDMIRERIAATQGAAPALWPHAVTQAHLV